MKVYERVRAYLDSNGIPRKTAARKTDIPAPLFEAILDGDKPMRIDDLRAICFALNVKPETFVGDQTA